MTLVEIFEPVFQYVCRLNRSARKGGRYDYDSVRNEIKSLLAASRTRATTGGRLVPGYDQCELVVTFFIDFTIRSSALKFAREWKDLAAERGERNGDEKFFEILDQTMADHSDAATEMIAVFYTCIGLGFTGRYSGQPEQLRRKMLEISARLGSRVDADSSAKICQDAYETVNTSDLIQPPGKSLTGIVIALIGLIAVLFVTNVYLYEGVLSDLKTNLKQIETK